MASDIGLIGLAVMGENLVLNMESKGFSVSVYNRTTAKVDAFLAGRGKGKHIVGTHDLATLVSSLKRPRKVMMMVRAGDAVDSTIEQLIPLLEKGDVIIDGGNSLFEDTRRRCSYVESKGLLYVGTGVSGGEEGALHGPSMMPGGSKDAWPLVQPIFQTIAAQVDRMPCCDWIGSDGAGHYVKMVHNGIEYGDMQIIGEIYDIMHRLLGFDYPKMQKIFQQWNGGDLQSYLIEITADILGHVDTDGQPLVEHILDAAGQKGTGEWTGTAALRQGIPLTLIVESVFARSLSSRKKEREVASRRFDAAPIPELKDTEALIPLLHDALLAAKIVSYAQGFSLMQDAAKRYGWDLDLGTIALLWRGGCIIRSAFLGKIKDAYEADPSLGNLILDPYFHDILNKNQESLRRIVSMAVLAGIPTPSLSAALSWFDGYRSARLPANLLQAQRDYFGAHTYERVDRKRGEFFHTDWTGHGGKTSSTVYNV